MSQEKKQKQKETRKEVSSMIEVVRIFKMDKEDNNLKAFVDITVCDTVLIKGIRVLSKKEGGFFVAMPSHKADDGKYYDTVKLLTAEANQELQNVVLAHYQS